jgi:hypothetical protein
MRLVILLMVPYALLVFAGGGFMSLSRNNRLKQRIWPFYVFGAAALFWVSIPVLGFGWGVAGIMAIFVAAISVFNFKRVRFCRACGRTSWGNTFGPAQECDECGSALDPSWRSDRGASVRGDS